MTTIHFFGISLETAEEIIDYLNKNLAIATMKQVDYRVHSSDESLPATAKEYIPFIRIDWSDFPMANEIVCAITKNFKQYGLEIERVGFRPGSNVQPSSDN